MTRVTEVHDDYLTFDDGSQLFSDHDQDCCESHYLDFSNLTMGDFEGLDFDLSGKGWFEEVDGYGIRLLPTNGLPVSVPGYGRNNGYYSSNLTLILRAVDRSERRWDITDCQDCQEWD